MQWLWRRIWKWKGFIKTYSLLDAGHISIRKAKMNPWLQWAKKRCTLALVKKKSQKLSLKFVYWFQRSCKGGVGYPLIQSYTLYNATEIAKFIVWNRKSQKSFRKRNKLLKNPEIFIEFSSLVSEKKRNEGTRLQTDK
jgi:hypothetical protein